MRIVYLVLTFIINLYCLYYIIIGIGYYKKKKKDKLLKNKKNHFTILLPARNEESVISNLIDSLKKQNYPKEKYDIWVVLNNSTDNTKEVVLKNKVNVYECKNIIKNKGDALKEILNHFNNKDTDAYLIFDADNLVHPDFINNMNVELNSGAKVAQGLRDIKNQKNNWISSSYGIYFFIQNMFLNEARTNLNMSSFINGTGMMISKQVIDEIGYDTYSLTEDIEFKTICAINKIPISYVKNAIIYDEHPSSLKVSYLQRKRWSKGDVQCLKLYYKRIFKEIKKGNLACFDCLMTLLAPFAQIVTLFMTFFSIVMFDTLKDCILFSIFTFLVTTLVQAVLYSYVILKHDKRVKDHFFGIIFFQIFILTWLPINIIILFNKDIKWDEIIHNRSVKLEDIKQ